MRHCILCLILFFGPAVKIKEACNNRSGSERTPAYGGGEFTEKQVEDAPLFDLLIIGAGVQGWKLLKEFSKWKYPDKHGRKFKIGIVETKPKLGHGLPYDGDEVIPEHLMFSFKAIVQMSFLDNYIEEERETVDETADAYKRVVLLPPAPRYAYGKFLVDEFDTSVKQCEEKNYKIELMPNTTAVNVERGTRRGFIVTLSGDHSGTLTTVDIFLATGHWFASRFETEVDGYFESPWPASKVQNKTEEAVHVAIFGSGQSAIDTAMTLAHKFGIFEYKDGRFHFKIKPEYEQGDFKMTMYSRSGHLPPVAATAIDVLPRNFLSTKADEIKARGIGWSKKFLSLDEILKLLKGDLVALIPAIKYDIQFSFNPKELMDRINLFAYGRKDYKQRFIHDIEEAFRSLIRRSPLLLPVFFHYIDDPFNIFLEYFSAEDTISFKKYIAPAIAKWYAPISPHNAEKLYALMNASCLFLEAVGDDSRVTADEETNKGVRIHYKEKQIYHRYFIDAKGQSGDISKDTRPLTQNLLKNKLIQPMYIPYSNKKKGRADMDEEKRKNPQSDMFKNENSKIYHKSDGILVNWKTFHAIPPGETVKSVIKKAHKGVIYASGPFTYHRYALAQSLGNGAELAEPVVADIRNRYF